jgi:uncharacterized protein YndB with AHSA1/START domain
MAIAKITPDLDAVVAEVEIAAPPERVFQALIDPAQLQRWFNDASCPVKSWEFEGRKGGRFRYRTAPSATVSVNGVSQFECHGEVLEFDPPRLLVYTWIANWHANPQQAAVVRWELQPSGAGTKLTVTHSGLAQEKVAREDYGKGWIGVVEKLRSFVEAQ